MSNLDTTYSLNLNNLKLQDGDFVKSSDWTEKIYENGGFTNNDQFMVFNCDGIEVVVDFELTVAGRVDYDPGDYWTPPYTDVDVTDIEILVKSLAVDEWEVELTKEIEDFLVKEIKNYL